MSTQCWCLMARAKLNETHSFVLSLPFFGLCAAKYCMQLRVYIYIYRCVRFFKRLLFLIHLTEFPFGLLALLFVLGFLSLVKKCVANLCVPKKRLAIRSISHKKVHYSRLFVWHPPKANNSIWCEYFNDTIAIVSSDEWKHQTVMLWIGCRLSQIHYTIDSL